MKMTEEGLIRKALYTHIIIFMMVIVIMAVGASCKTPTPTSLPPTPTPTSVSPTQTPTPTPVVVSPLPTGEVKPRAVEQQALPGSVITGTIAVFWRDPVGPEPQEIISSGIITSELFIDLELRLANGEVLTQTIVTGLSAPNEPGEFQFNGSFNYGWQNVPFGVHQEYARLRWELESSDVLTVTEVGTYELHRETVYGVLVVDHQRVPLDERNFGLYRTVSQYHYYYLPVIMRSAP